MFNNSHLILREKETQAKAVNVDSMEVNVIHLVIIVIETANSYI